MDINSQLQPIIISLLDGIKASIEQEIRDKITQEIINKVASTEITGIINQIVTKQLEERLINYNLEATSKEKLDNLVGILIKQF